MKLNISDFQLILGGTKVRTGSQSYRCDLNAPIDISIPITPNGSQPKAFGAPDFKQSPVRAGSFVGSTQERGPLNFMNMQINPHGNGTHTECVGHIAAEQFTINQCLKTYFHLARLISIEPAVNHAGASVIEANQIDDESLIGVNSLIIRTLPKDISKLNRDYTGTNPPYLSIQAMEKIVNYDIEHLLLDLPSVDPEQDDGALSAHKIFWNYPSQAIRENATITEMIYVPHGTEDGLYLLNLQITSFETDASPSKPVLYRLEQ